MRKWNTYKKSQRKQTSQTIKWLESGISFKMVCNITSVGIFDRSLFLETRLDDQADQEEFYLNCVLDAVSEDYNLLKLQADYTPEDSRLTKNKFMLKYINDITRS